MKLEKYRQLMAVCAVALFYTGLDLYLYLSERTQHPPLVWMAVFGVLCGPLLLARAKVDAVTRTPLVWWCAGFLLISGGWLFFQPVLSEVVWEEARRRLLSVLFLLTLLLVFTGESAQMLARRSVLCAVVLAVALNLYELFAPLSFSEVVGRSAGLYINPNKTGVALVLGMIIGAGGLPERYRVLLVLLAGVGVAATFSRAAMVAWALVAVLMFVTRQVSLRRSLPVGVLGVLVVALALIPWWGGILERLDDGGGLNANVMARLEWFRSGQAEDASSLERREVAELAWGMFFERPLEGHGVAASIDWGHEKSSHNVYLNMMVDHGVLGVLVLPLLVAAVTGRARGEARRLSFVFGFFVLYMGFFSHNLLEERYVLVAYALIAAIVQASGASAARRRAAAPREFSAALPERLRTA